MFVFASGEGIFVSFWCGEWCFGRIKGLGCWVTGPDGLEKKCSSCNPKGPSSQYLMTRVYLCCGRTLSPGNTFK